jgi:hypothetical protein
MDTATIEQTVTAVAGGTAITVGQIGQIIHQSSSYRVVGESLFYELSLDGLTADGAADPPRAEELTALLAEHRLLILAGALEDKAECARRIAGRLQLRLKAEGRRVSIRERHRGKDPQRIETAFHEEATTILLLTEISQSLIAGYDPAKLRRLLLERGGYAIVTTDCNPQQWAIADGTLEARLWQELSWETYYGRDFLVGYLERLFFDSDLEIPAGLLPADLDGELQVGGVPFAQAAETLKNPERIRTFVTSLVEAQTPPTPEDVAAILAALAGDAAAIHRWFLQFGDRDQMLVVGLVLLDGLPDDLLFAGLELLVETIWRQTDPQFPQFDYRDLARFAAYFKQTPVDGGFVRIESGSRQRRADILQVAWNHQRRRLLATLPALTEMIRASASAPPPAAGDAPEPRPAGQETASDARLAAERSLSRSKNGSVQLHQVVVESLSLIGLLSVEVVEPYLLDLAADPSESVQLLVARALAIWREAGKEEEFFSLLLRWWSDACDVGNGDSAIARTTSFSPDPWAAVRATLGMAIGFAAQYDREGELSPALRRLLQVIVDDPHPRVRQAVLQHALPRTVAWHLRQLEPFLCERVLAAADAVQAVARGAAEACEMRPSECLPIVERWWATARADTRHGSRWAVAPREILLATVAETYGYVRCSAEQPWMSPEMLAGKLRTMLNEEGHPFVRRHALQAVEIQTRSDVELAVRLLPDLLARLTIEDRPQVSALAVRCYLHQRQHLAGGDRKLELDGRSYAVWTDGPRPLTGIEAILYGWLLDRSRPIAQQVAVDVFAAFAATSLEREERRLLSARPRAAANGYGATAAAAEPEVHRLNAFGHLAVVMATLHKDEVRPLLRPLMAGVIVEMRRQQLRAAEKLLRSRRLLKGKAPAAASQPATEMKTGGSTPVEETLTVERIELLLERWGGVRNASARSLAAYLQRAVHYYHWRWGVVLAMALLFAGLANLYRRADRAVVEPLEVLAAKVIPAPDVLEDLMAPLPPGRLAEEPARFPYVLECIRAEPNQRVSWRTANLYLMALLPTGAPPRLDEPERLIQFLVTTEDRAYEATEGIWTIPTSHVLGEFAAPLPPDPFQLHGVRLLQPPFEHRAPQAMQPGRRAVSLQWGATPKERAKSWRQTLLLTR